MHKHGGFLQSRSHICRGCVSIGGIFHSRVYGFHAGEGERYIQLQPQGHLPGHDTATVSLLRPLLTQHVSYMF